MENGTFELRLDKAWLRLVDLDKAYGMRTRWDEKRHSNAQWELHMILEGTCRVDLEAQSVDLGSGQALLIRPGQYHRPRSCPGAFRRLSLAFFVEKGRLREQLEQRCSGSLLIERDDTLLQLAGAILRELGGKYSFRQTCLEGMLAQLIVTVLRRMDVTEEAPGGKTPGNKQITGVIDTWFEEHFADSAGETELAACLHISRRQLVRIMQEHYGMNFREKLICARMDYAAWLLRTTGKRVAEICQIVGYSSEAAFFKTFRNYFGMTPSGYRKEKQR